MSKTAARMLVWIVGMTGPMAIAGVYAILGAILPAIVAGFIISTLSCFLYGEILVMKMYQQDQKQE